MIYSVIPAGIEAILRGAPLPYFRVMMEGSGIIVPTEGSKDFVGFFTTRVVRADSESAAISAAKAMVESDWKSPEYASINRGKVPDLTVEWVYRDSFLGALRFNNGGHVFFPEDDEDAGSNAVV